MRQLNFLLDGPPSMNGEPGLHHVYNRTIKDVLLRTYNEKTIPGFDEHGLPIELKVEEILGGKNVVETKEFVSQCENLVVTNRNLWLEFYEKFNSEVVETYYNTSSEKYIRKTWEVFAKFYHEKLVYKKYSIQPYSPAAGTNLSHHELNLPGSYINETVLAPYVLFKVCGEEKYLVIWTTTPWSLPANSAIAVSKNIQYVIVNQKYIVSKQFAIEFFKVENFELIDTDKITELKYEQPFNGKVCSVFVSDHVNEKPGSGLVHIAPAYGADDFKMHIQHNVDMIVHIDKDGRFNDQFQELKGKFFRKEFNPSFDSNKYIIKQLEKRELILHTDKIEHSYPYCWRTNLPIIYYPVESYFIKTTSLKDRLLENEKQITYLPDNTHKERFRSWLENVQDWNVSREKIWGIPIPIFVSEDQEEYFPTPEELQSLPVHKPKIDSISFEKNGKVFKRIPYVFDVWFDSGCAAYVTLNSNPEFVVEGIDQTRGWFYTSHVINTFMFNKPVANNIVCNGFVVDKNGKKMSKRLGNYIVPSTLIEKYGVDELRFALLYHSPITSEIKFDEATLSEVKNKFFMKLDNCFNFYKLYKEIDGWEHDLELVVNQSDKWIITKFNTLKNEVDVHLKNIEYNIATRKLVEFVEEEFSNWYIRINRKRFWENGLTVDKRSGYYTLSYIINKLVSLAYPICPLLKKKHQEYYKFDYFYYQLDKISNQYGNSYSVEFEQTRKVCNELHAIRKKEKIAVKYPLTECTIPYVLDEYFIQVIKNEVNVESVICDANAELSLNTTINDELTRKYNLRVLTREIQLARKNAGCKVENYVNCLLHYSEELTEIELKNLKRECLIQNLVFEKSKQLKVSISQIS